MISEQEISSHIVRFIFHTLETQEQICSIAATIELGNDKSDSDYELSCPIKLESSEGKIAFNHKYVMDAIKPFSMCNLEIQSPSSPGKFTGDIEGLTIITMPMFVQWEKI